ncbi:MULTISPECIES: NAD(P)H-dependent glycerol-3-phosphate dehydrogenase [unclassified Sulfuricurvum]|uniref:NAD(P)H-dependent glycerol-3-phosphate dehydrogenase n=1 Tax=unclassified Sulfuricurvum TaxID=2632390 RepID=UPI0002997B38|nr:MULTISPECIES: NAD(P)H-dependent glycerol-3-phosphate dehydrogenase [unclassified Sulfuricurvum]OHD83279.1 MAG: glycerol-3-phosphate dehydrogenase [Sulfuricurvum sp. RIFCSPHIGHO2_02_FULL_43_9]OHD83791.1 MAG: glycerol-3-phosphate dehydrogenase [Sulfuricurvum sp. RIFCSPLOWO2_02_43_6]OHD85775.1 MAG: glycerol-3-phosphate dehydrogenase [Sulfuricurvum sp. RIFCSPLOWO2_02_FULL_43_45]AFV97907.1 NAD(P)H-dependent glycerol-3-phosphate dehydrogenase [Candidatus Sulfuricurvum sp. RIFRC-1]OHD89013.1 MAG: 
MKVGVIGAGKWGEALAFAMGEKNEVIITSRTPRDWDNFKSLEEVLGCEYLIITVPAQQIGKWLEENFIFKGQKVLVAAKGIEASSGKFLNEIYAQYVPEENLCFLSGPSFAAEVIQSLPTALVINSSSESTAKEFAALFPSFIRTYVSSDVIGAEITGAYKNVIAIAAGICEGLGLGHNAAASLISRGLVEMERFGRSYGATQESFLGLSGAGDLFLTASSSMSRNYRVGLGLSQGKTKEVVCQEIGEVSEGIGTAYALHEIAIARGIYLPIAAEVYAILEGKSPRQSLKDLIER